MMKYIPYRQKYWRELNLAVDLQIAITKILADLKFGGSVKDRHTYNIICKKYWRIFEFGDCKQGRPPNSILQQIFRLYDNL